MTCEAWAQDSRCNSLTLKHELHFGGVKQLTRARRAADAVVSVAEKVHEQQRTGGEKLPHQRARSITCSVRARGSRWERFWITKAADLSVRGFHVGDSVEVYSNSARCGVLALFGKIAEHTISTGFQLPNAKT